MKGVARVLLPLLLPLTGKSNANSFAFLVATVGLPSQEHAEIIRPMAFNQGFYNLFLALGSLIGIAILGINSTVGFTLMIFGSFCMVGAGAVLFISTKKSRKAAIIQGLPPLLGVLIVLAGLSR